MSEQGTNSEITRKELSEQIANIRDTLMTLYKKSSKPAYLDHLGKSDMQTLAQLAMGICLCSLYLEELEKIKEKNLKL